MCAQRHTRLIRIGTDVPRILLLMLLCWSVLARAAAPNTEPDIRLWEEGGKYRVSATIQVPVAPAKAWNVLIDFDHMAEFIPYLQSSQIKQRKGRTWQIEQTGEISIGPFSHRYESQREISLLPYKSIQSRTLNGTMNVDSVTLLIPNGKGTTIRYDASGTPGVAALASIGLSYMGERVKAQFAAIRAEILKRNGLPQG